MQLKLTDFAARQGLALPSDAAERLLSYAQLVWQKKGFLNLTSADSLEEILARHVCDGLAAAACLAQRAMGKESVSVADMGAGAGYIGLSIAIALPQAHVSLVESLEKRCSFLNWAVLKLGLKNVSVRQMRLGQTPLPPFDFVTERAMGQLNDILPLIAPCVAPGGLFAAYQSRPDQAEAALLSRCGLRALPAQAYRLPGEQKERYLALFTRADAE